MDQADLVLLVFWEILVDELTESLFGMLGFTRGSSVNAMVFLEISTGFCGFSHRIFCVFGSLASTPVKDRTWC